MIKVGITGGIGSGKSTVAKIFEVLGIPVYYADDAAKYLMDNDVLLRESIQKEFGEDVYKNEKLDRAYLANIVFKNPAKLEKLNALVHPATIADAEKWMSQQIAPYAIKEAALIFESNAQKKLDYVIGVYAPTAMRIRRVMVRDKISKETVEQRMSNQIDESIKMKLCDFVIVNDEQQLVTPQVLEVHKKLCKI